MPNGFKRSYIVPIPKVQDCQTKATSCDDFRGIVAVNRDQHPKYLNLFTLSISLPSINTLWVPISAGSMTIIHVFAEFIFSPNKRLIFCDSLTWCCNSSGDVYLYSWQCLVFAHLLGFYDNVLYTVGVCQKWVPVGVHPQLSRVS